MRSLSGASRCSSTAASSLRRWQHDRRITEVGGPMSCGSDIVSSALIQGRPQTAGSVARVWAAKIEAAIVDAIRRHFGLDAPSDDAELIARCVHRIEVRRTEIAVALLSHDDTFNADATRFVLAVPWSKPPHRRRRDVIALEGGSPAAALPIRADVRVKLITAIARARQWLSEVETGTATVDGIAAREARSKRHVSIDDLVGFPRAKPRQGCCRWSVAARNRCRPPFRCTGSHGRVSMCCSARPLTRYVPRSASSTAHNRLLAGSSPANSTTQSCAIPVSWRRRNGL
jgi:hypothetical protein